MAPLLVTQNCNPSMLRNCYPSRFGLNEGVFRTDALLTPEELGWPRLWYKVCDKLALGEDEPPSLAQRVKEDWAPFLDRGKPVFLEKSVCNATRIPWLCRWFPNAAFVFIVRHPLPVAEGIRRRSRKGRWWTERAFDGDSYPIPSLPTYVRHGARKELE